MTAQSQAAVPSTERDELLRYLAVDPTNANLLNDAIRASLAMGDAAGARQLIGRARELHPDHPGFQHLAAHAAMSARDWPGAIALLETLLQTHADVHLQRDLGLALFMAGRHADSLRALALALDEDPVVQEYRLRAVHHVGTAQEGLEAALAAVALPQASANLFGVASLVAFDADRLDLARAWAQAALDRDPDQYEARLTRAYAAASDGDDAQADVQLRQMLAQRPSEPRAISALGITLLARSQTAEALPLLQAAVSGMPGHIGSWHALGWCEMVAGNPVAARAAFEQALELDHNFAESHGAMAVVQAIAGDRDAAEHSIRTAERLDPRNAPAKYARLLLSGAGSDQRAVATLAKSLLRKIGRTLPSR